jgi:hypothetical protein
MLLDFIVATAVSSSNFKSFNKLALKRGDKADATIESCWRSLPAEYGVVVQLEGSRSCSGCY